MSEKSQLIDRLKDNGGSREAYTRAKLSVNIPSQIRALRRRRNLTQTELAQEAAMKQSRISAIERPGAVNLNIETLIRVAAAFKVALVVKFAPFGELLDWENEFSQDSFDVATIENDKQFQEWRPRVERRRRRKNTNVVFLSDSKDTTGAFGKDAPAYRPQQLQLTFEGNIRGVQTPVAASASAELLWVPRVKFAAAGGGYYGG